MSASVWNEEVNLGLINEILKVVKVRDKEHKLQPLERRGVIVRKPDTDFSSEVYPCVSIYLMSIKQDNSRLLNNFDKVLVELDKENKTATYKDPLIPFKLLYQLDFWSKYQQDMDDMLKTWLREHPKNFNLEVLDEDGVVQSCNVITEGNIIRSDLISGGKRLFHSAINYTIWVELETNNLYNESIVVDTNVKDNIE